MGAPDDRPPDLACQQVVELVTEYLEDALSPEERRGLEAHLAGCRDCRAYLEQIRLTIRAVAATREAAPDPRVKTELLRLFRTWTQTPDR